MCERNQRIRIAKMVKILRKQICDKVKCHNKRMQTHIFILVGLFLPDLQYSGRPVMKSLSVGDISNSQLPTFSQQTAKHHAYTTQNYYA